jgi:hypothetical protein
LRLFVIKRIVSFMYSFRLSDLLHSLEDSKPACSSSPPPHDNVSLTFPGA